MKATASGIVLAFATLAAAAAGAARAEEAVKPGRWEFTSQLQMPAMPKLPPGVSLPPGVQAQPGGGMTASHTGCIDPERALPTDPRQNCKIDNMTRNGGTITWSSTCTAPQGAARSEGVAHYHGDTMEATLTTRVPTANGGTMENTQHITGRYLGPCTK